MANLTKADRKGINASNLAATTYSYNPVIANGATASDGMRLSGDNLIGISFPAAMTSATMTVETSMDGVTWKALAGVTLSVTANESYNIAVGTVQGWPFVRLIAASAEGAERTLTVLFKEL